ncbi:MAG: glucosylceramidase [Candidatus Hydrogenedentota bacterium]
MTLQHFAPLTPVILGLLVATAPFECPAQSTIEVWVSSLDKSKALTPEAPLEPSGESAAAAEIHVDETRTYQTVLGLGASLEHSTCYNISLLAPEKQEHLIESLVDPDKGIGMNLMRVCIGTSDFTGDPWYSYNDLPDGETDPDLKNFSIEKDRAYVLPVLKLALKKNPNLLFYASPWSPPGWMKDRGRGMCGGILKPDYYGVYARYLAKFVQAYQAEGVPLHAMTLQNEPGVNTQQYPSCYWRGEWQRDFIRDYVGPLFSAERIATRIWCFDHNFNNLAFPRTVLGDPEAAKYVEGTAFHLYEGRPEAMSALHDEFPDKQIFFSEGSVYGTRGALQIISYFRNWAQSYNAWVTVIDQDAKPNNGPHECDPTVIVLDTRDMSLEYRNDYYIYGQFMKFIQRGAARIDSTPGEGPFNNVAFKNPDGSIVVIVANDTAAIQPLSISCGETRFGHSLTPYSVATYRFRI